MTSENETPQVESSEVPKENASTKGTPSVKSKKSSNITITHKCTKYVTLLEDHFGYVIDKAGKQHSIKKFTWKNHNNIQAQVITYGARVVSLKLPNRKRIVEDVVMGFDDIGGYLYYDKSYMGATIGRVTDKIEKGTFVIDKQQYWLTVNDECHHCNGGFKGLDKAVWIPSVQDTKVVLTYVSHDLDEGYPGDLFIRIVFELTPKNEFIIDMDAVTTKPTLVNLSNLLYFNLGGHGAGPDELYKHIVTINANCFLPFMENGLPTGEIQNVIYTKNDYQIPQLLKDTIGVNPDDGFDGHLCINRAVEQGVCFMARALHPPSGRVLELYSNQYGLHFNTGNHFGHGLVDIPVSIKSKDSILKDESGIFELINKLHEHLAETVSIDSKTNYTELRQLIQNLHKRKFNYEPKEDELERTSNRSREETLKTEHPDIESLILNPLQVKYLEGILTTIRRRTSLTSYSALAEIIEELLNIVIIKEEIEMRQHEPEDIIKNETEIREEENQRSLEELKEKEDEVLSKRGSIRLGNIIPGLYKDGRIHGKNRAIYKRHGGICFQSENYPNAIYHRDFPNPILRPGETYRHTIVYKFWVQAGIPHQWMKRNFPKKQF